MSSNETILILLFIGALVYSAYLLWNGYKGSVYVSELKEKVKELENHISRKECSVEFYKNEIQLTKERCRNVEEKHIIESFKTESETKKANSYKKFLYVMLNKGYEVVENSKSFMETLQDGEYKYLIVFDKKIDHDYIYDEENKKLYKVIGYECLKDSLSEEYTYSLKQVK